MKKKKVFGALLAGALTLSLLPASALAITGADLPEELTYQWDHRMLLSHPDVEGAPDYNLIPSSFDAENFRLVKAVNSNGSAAAVEYDSRGSITKITYTFPDENGKPAEISHTWQYDSQGREVCLTEGVWGYTTETAYDSQGRVAKKTYIMGANAIDVLYSYDSQGRLAEVRNEDEGAPGLDTYTYTGKNLVKVESVSDGVKSETLYTYDQDGKLTEKKETRYDPDGYGSMKVTESQTTSYAYDGAGRVTNLKSDRTNSEGKRDFSEEYQWTYFMDGKLNSQSYAFELLNEAGRYDLNAKDCAIRYDNAGRVSRVDATGATYRYTYDDNGNNTQIAVTDEEDGDYTFTFTYEPVKAEAPAPAGPAAPAAPSAFADVSAGAWYAAPVAWAVEKGVTTGTSETAFSPDQSCTRAQVVTFLWRAMGQPQAFGAEAFTDVEKGSWYEDAVAWAVEKGITTGTSETTFSPEAPCTRAQVVTFLWRALDKPQAMNGADLFTDVPEDAYFFQPVLWALDKGVTTGTGEGVFSPDDTCTRAQVVTFLYRALAE